MNRPIIRLPASSQTALSARIPDSTAISDELLQSPRWLLWRLRSKREKAKPAKIPYYVDGGARNGPLDSPQDLARLKSFSDAIAAAADPSGGWSGVGLAVTSDAGVGGIDLDDCLDQHGEFNNETARAVYETAESDGCYCEVSPSGRGLRIIGKTNGFSNFNRGGFEAYCSKRFLTITGNCRANPKGLGSVDRAVQLIIKQVPGGTSGLTTTPIQVVDEMSAGIYSIPASVQQGGRNDAILKYVGHLRGKGTSESSILQAACDFNAERCMPPLETEEVEQIVGRYAISQGAGTTDGVGDWPDPVPITAALHAVSPFELDLLPDKFRPYVQDIAELTQTPPDYIAVSLMVAASATLGNTWAIAPKAHDLSWKAPPTLWGGVVGRPGTMKSHAMGAALNPVYPIENSFAAQHQLKQQQYQVDKLKYETQYNHAKKALAKNPGAPVALPLKPEEPQPEHLLVNDTTYEKLGEILRWSPRGVLVFMDELVGLLKGLETKGQEKARAFFLSAWNGDQPYNFERIGRGSFTIPRLSACVLGGIQPDKLKEYTSFATKGGSGDDGLMQRFQLLVWPDPIKEWENIDRPYDFQAHDDVLKCFKYLRDLKPADVGAHDDGFGKPAYLRFAPDAQGEFNEIRSACERQVRSGRLETALEAHLAKYPRMIASLAMLIHLIDGHKGPVSLRATKMAGDWSLYLLQHAQRIYSAASGSASASAKALSEKISAGKLGSEFTAREIRRKGWRNLSTREDVSAALDKLEDKHWVRVVEYTGMGRPSERYRVNPKALNNHEGV